jgi:hypothetical protein
LTETCLVVAPAEAQQRHYLYFCISKASKRVPEAQQCQYLYFCTSKASKLSA